MIERRPFHELPSEDLGWLKARRHFSSAAKDDPSRSGWGSARIFQMWVTPASPGGSPAWGVQPCPKPERSGCFVAIASGFDSDRDALPIRARARVLNAKLKVLESIEYVLREPRLAYLVPSTGTVDVNGVRIHARDGAAIKDVDMVTITAIEDADVLMVDVL